MEQFKAKTVPVKAGGMKINFGKGFTISGVTGIIHSGYREIVASVAGNTLSITGSGLNILRLDVESGEADIGGSLYSLKYTKGMSGASFFKRLLK